MSGVTRTKDDWSPWYERTKAELTRLGALTVRVGILGSEDSTILKIAAVHEYGATITAKRAKNLAIPLKPEMRDLSPREVPDTFVYNNGENRFIARRRGKGRNATLELLFLLVPRVTIPERSFIRAGYDGNKDLLAAACKEAVRRARPHLWCRAVASGIVSDLR